MLSVFCIEGFVSNFCAFEKAAKPYSTTIEQNKSRREDFLTRKEVPGDFFI